VRISGPSHSDQIISGICHSSPPSLFVTQRGFSPIGDSEPTPSLQSSTLTDDFYGLPLIGLPEESIGSLRDKAVTAEVPSSYGSALLLLSH